jgi:hypothetical protein
VLPSIGEPVVAHSSLGTLVAQSVGQNTEGERAVPNPVVLVDRLGEISDLPPLPSDLPLQMVRVAPSGAGFVLTGYPCAPIPAEEMDTSGCAADEVLPVAFRFDGEEWAAVGPMPKPATTGLIPLDGGDRATFLTSSGSVISYDEVAEQWAVRRATPADEAKRTPQLPAGDEATRTQVTAVSVETDRTVSVVSILSDEGEGNIDHFEIRVEPH